MNLCFFPVANCEPRMAAYGDRWYQVQNMEAGIIVQRLYLAAAALGLGCPTPSWASTSPRSTLCSG